MLKKVTAQFLPFTNNRNRHLYKNFQEYGIGKPSTFAILVNAIQERIYVIIKKDIEGEVV